MLFKRTAIILLLLSSVHGYSKACDQQFVEEAIYFGNIDQVQRMIQADPDIITRAGEMALMTACSRWHHEIMQLLLKSGVELGEPTYYALWGAAAEDNIEGLHLLLNYGAEVDAADEYGDTSLHKACRFRALNAVRLLIEKGAQIEVKNHNKQTPLIMAALHNNPVAVADLIKVGADINAQDQCGKTALIHAAEREFLCAARDLISLGANQTIKDNDGKTFKEYANSLLLKDFLTEEKKDPNSCSKDLEAMGWQDWILCQWYALMTKVKRLFSSAFSPT